MSSVWIWKQGVLLSFDPSPLKSQHSTSRQLREFDTWEKISEDVGINEHIIPV